MATVTPSEARDMFVGSVKRALHGPTGPDPGRWPGNDQPVTVVEPDQTFADWKALGNGLVDGEGQEVLAVSPARLYGVGVLYPHMTRAESDALSTEQELTDQEEVTSGPRDKIPDPAGDPDDAEDTVQVPGGGNRPRSLAVSFHIPDAVAEVTVTFRGARYRRLPVVIGGSPVDLWRRVPLTETFTLDPGHSSSHTVDVEGLTFNVGVDSRPLGDTGSRLVTVYLANMSESAGDTAATCLFQSELLVEVDELLPYPSPADGLTADASLELLYRKHPVRAIGHGTDAVAEPTGSGWLVRSESFPVVLLKPSSPDILDAEGRSYAVGMDDLGHMNEAAATTIDRIIRDYRSWVAERRREAVELADERLRVAAEDHLQACESFADDMTEGWQLARSNDAVARCLRWTSHVMNNQRAASIAPLRPVTVSKSGSTDAAFVAGTNPHLAPRRGQAYWRPFQVAFLLASLAAAVDPQHPKREHVDIVWMPTGGGKTEAYLGLAAFTMLWQRSRRVAAGTPLTATVDVLMRYTLRLLTAQQVQRAAALICALEVLRKENPHLLGSKPFRIGAFLGKGSTPNTREKAVGLLSTLTNGRASRTEQGFLLTRCPWCGAQMGLVDGTVVGYAKVPLRSSGHHRVSAACPAADCPFAYSGDPGNPGGLPVLEVDEDIYAQPPAFVVGTIDKFAQLAWKSQARRLFGLSATKDGKVRRTAPPPSLFIQDELHLIAGPLGSLDALYEVTLQQLCEFDGGTPPRVVAATATTRNFHKQVLRLYGRAHARLVPPPALDVDDSFFARVDPDSPGKVFLAVCAPGYGSNVQAQLRTLAAAAHAAGVLDVADADPDPWWTNLAFFSSRRSLGLQLSAAQTGLGNAMVGLSRVSGMRVGRVTDHGTRAARRSIGQVRELTATSRDNVTGLLAQLTLPKSQPGCIDLCFATSMIEVGVDVSRLGLMTVMGQPKSYSQYIQVTGRVGRSDTAPGVVLVVLSPFSVRDRSHYETFTATHQRMYAAVEPVSLTPFTPQALERGLAGAVTGVLRTTSVMSDPTPLLGETAVRQAVEPWRARAAALDGDRAVNAVAEETSRLVRLAHAAVTAETQLPLEWGDFRGDGRPFLRPLGDDAVSTEGPGWRAPVSMRSVDGEAGVRIPRGVAPGRVPAALPETEAEEF